METSLVIGINMYDLTGKIAIVTGAGGRRGFGRAIAKRLAKDGADIVVIDKFALQLRDKDLTDGWKGIESVADEIKALNRQALAITCDITNSEEVDRMVKDTVAEFGGIDILVNNAGLHIYSSIQDISDEIWESHLAVNLTGTFYCSRAVVQEMMQRGEGGRIINIASLLGKVGMGNAQTAYCASKFGVVGFTQSLALELASHNILVNAVCPALADTDIHNDAFNEEAEREGISVQEIRTRMHDEVIPQIPLGRLTTAGDIANMVAFLASDEASFITGQSINVNGGLLTAH
ncbi:SDR family NAD(P)-dependent oxidoreductase [Chloroflexota bacterium]